MAVVAMLPAAYLYRRDVKAWCSQRISAWPSYSRNRKLEDPGRGDLAAAAIRNARTFSIAAEIFNNWRWSLRPRVPEQAFAAMEDRLRSEGESEETVRFLIEHGVWAESEAFLPDNPVNDPNRFEWALMIFGQRQDLNG